MLRIIRESTVVNNRIGFVHQLFSRRPTGVRRAARTGNNIKPSLQPCNRHHTVKISAAATLKGERTAATTDGIKLTLTLGALDNERQVPNLTLEFKSLHEGKSSAPFSTSHWEHAEDGSSVSGLLPSLPQGFGKPGAVIITLEQKQPTKLHKVHEFFLEDLVLEFGKEKIIFTIQSFVDHDNGGRIFFASEPCLPGNTPAGISDLRLAELRNKRGEDPTTGKVLPAASAERKGGDRIYDYAPFNDLAKPPKEPRKVLGTKDTPYARRMRTGRKILPDGSEERPPGNDDIWLPPDERFRQLKKSQFDRDTNFEFLLLARTLVGEVFDTTPLRYTSFEDLYSMYGKKHANPNKGASAGNAIRHLELKDPKLSEALQEAADVEGYLKRFGNVILGADKWEPPLVRDGREMYWMTDEEFGRQTLAAMNPSAIFRVSAGTSKDFLADFIKAEQEGKLVLPAPIDELIKEGRLYGLDQHTGYIEYVGKVNQLNEERHQYAGRTLLVSKEKDVIAPVAIMLYTTPPGKAGPVTSELYTPSRSLPEWNAAKIVFNSLDSGTHQLVVHHMRAHVCLESFIISLHRNISALHPVYKLMMPYFRYTLAINAKARKGLISAGDQIEKCWTPGKYAMELTARCYDVLWTFESNDIETDLIARGMVKTDAQDRPVREAGKLVPRLDFPYAEDGLDIYYALREYFTEYLGLYYSDTGAAGKPKVTDDVEVMAWWKEAREKGHPEKKHGWIELTDISSLARILTIIVWTASAHHSAVNYGQYDYAGWMPTRPSLVRKPIPTEGKELEDLKNNFEKSILKIISDPKTTLMVMLVMKVLSEHHEDELYLTDHNVYLTEPLALEAEKRFHDRLTKIEHDIDARNAPGKSKVRSGGGDVSLPYTLLTPYLKPLNQPAYKTGQRGIAASVTV